MLPQVWRLKVPSTPASITATTQLSTKRQTHSALLLTQAIIQLTHTHHMPINPIRIVTAKATATATDTPSRHTPSRHMDTRHRRLTIPLRPLTVRPTTTATRPRTHTRRPSRATATPATDTPATATPATTLSFPRRRHGRPPSSLPNLSTTNTVSAHSRMPAILPIP